MPNPRDILVITTSSAENLSIRKYLKPVSAHIVAGTNMFNEFLGELTDAFGGRSKTYQKQLTALYNEAVEKIQVSAFEVGANCVLGLSIDMDEISGKGKAMFMITAVGTAVIVDQENSQQRNITVSETKLENVTVETINIYRRKKAIIEKANLSTLNLSQEIWEFIILNQVDEIFPYLLTKYKEALADTATTSNPAIPFQKHLISFFESLPEEKTLDILYSTVISTKNESVALKFSEIIKELNLFDFERAMAILESKNFDTAKRGVKIATYDKPFYAKKILVSGKR